LEQFSKVISESKARVRALNPETRAEREVGRKAARRVIAAAINNSKPVAGG
jgi:hypothetical protein